MSGAVSMRSPFDIWIGPPADETTSTSYAPRSVIRSATENTSAGPSASRDCTRGKAATRMRRAATWAMLPGGRVVRNAIYRTISATLNPGGSKRSRKTG